MGLLDDHDEVIDGDFGRGEPEIPAGIDVAIHSAAAVSFDPPIDEGFQTNVSGRDEPVPGRRSPAGRAPRSCTSPPRTWPACRRA